MKILKIFLLLMIVFTKANSENTLKGIVTDSKNNPLVGVSVYLPELKKGSITNNKGEYSISNLPASNLMIRFSYIGYNTEIRTISILKGINVENVTLNETAIKSQEIIVSGGFINSQHENAVKIDILNEDEFWGYGTPNFTSTLTQVAGVDMISKGSGVSKPVIRGLSMNDILVLNNNVRFENYQYSEHHPLGIEEFGIEDVEIIKGPASLLYGSDAIGGVINFIKEKPAPIGSLIGDYNLELFSNTLGITNNLGIKGATKNFYGGLRIGHKTNSDYLQGGGNFVPNSRFNILSIKANAGYTDVIGNFNLFYEYNNQKLGLVEDEVVERITERGRKNEIFYQEFDTHLLSSQNILYIGNYKLDLNAGLQSTELIHFGDINVFEIQMRLTTLTYDLKFHLPSGKNSNYILGFQGINQTNTNLNDRETKLLPDATTNNYSVFGLLQYSLFEKLKLQGGIRYDYKIISTQAVGSPTDTTTFRKALESSFGSFSGSFGATYNLSEILFLRANLASAYRTPNLAELTSLGPHEMRYEIGDQNLVPENSYEADISIHYHKDFIFDIAGFYNFINNYIFISPTGDTTENGMHIFKYKQTNSFLYGIEAGLLFEPSKLNWLNLGISFSFVIGKQENGDYLPFIPAHKLRFEICLKKDKIWFLNKPNIKLRSLTAFKQNYPAQEETKTDGYTIFDMVFTSEISTFNQTLMLGLSVNNLFDIKYFDHLSTLKPLNYYNEGRNISLSLKIPFAII